MKWSTWILSLQVVMLLAISCDKPEANNAQPYVCDGALACSSPYDRKCEGSNVYVCRDNGGCLEWVYSQTCSDWQTCENGMCGGGEPVEPIGPIPDVITQDDVVDDTTWDDVINPYCGIEMGPCTESMIGDGHCDPGCMCGEATFDWGDCECTPNCDWMECGDDGCGGSCGTCDEGMYCQSGMCVGDCEPDCYGKECGDDGCGNYCGECDWNFYCNENFECVCEPYCYGMECGDDGCGGTCGTCDDNSYCEYGQCICEPYCWGKDCGDDGCGGSCGTCGSGTACVDGYCEAVSTCSVSWACAVACEGDLDCINECFSGLSGTELTKASNLLNCLNGTGFGSCDGDQNCINVALDSCNASLVACAGTCTPHCSGLQCGSNGCKGTCGSCTSGQTCDAGICSGACTPQCLSKECGTDGCGGTCGTCLSSQVCSDEGLCETGGSCAGYCGAQNPVAGCYCDNECMGAGDCCPDVCTKCPTLTNCTP